jgi:hypothetical protein
MSFVELCQALPFNFLGLLAICNSDEMNSAAVHNENDLLSYAAERH